MTKQSPKPTDSSSGRRYGLISMLAMIVGVVVGSGIFAKNTQLWNDSNGSVIAITIAWIVGSLLVICMLVAFIEIASITSKKGQSGTMQNWSRSLYGEKTSRMIGFFYPVIYLPLLVAGLSGYSAVFLYDGLDASLGLEFANQNSEQWVQFIFIVLIGFLVITIAYGINALTSKPGKVAQVSGTVIKLLPIVTIVLIGAIPMLYSSSDVWQQMFDPSNTTYNPGLQGQSAGDITLNIMTLMPAVLFSFDGFLYAASLQNEGKKPSTFKVAAISGIMIIALLYITMSLFMFTIPGEANPGAFGDVAATLAIVLGPWALPTVSFIIFISIVTSVSGIAITSIRQNASLSTNDDVIDKEGKLIRRNSAGVPQNAGFLALAFTLVWFTIGVSADAIVMTVSVMTTGIVSGYGSVSLWLLDFITVIGFLVYTLLIVGIVRNRFTNNVDVDRTKLLWPAAIVVVPMIIGISGYFAYLTFSISFTDSVSLAISIIRIVLVVLIFAIIAGLLIYSETRVNKVKWTKDERDFKDFLLEAYDRALTLEEAIKEIGYPKSTKVKNNFASP